ncbi:hypothetical protein BJ742DRAFT_782614 [Cladochytrium replicatum]|nr:hypothetical protein BJ742DRAFT_782614 [Cladochytrium replicatum]
MTLCAGGRLCGNSNRAYFRRQVVEVTRTCFIPGFFFYTAVYRICNSKCFFNCSSLEVEDFLFASASFFSFSCLSVFFNTFPLFIHLECPIRLVVVPIRDLVR